MTGPPPQGNYVANTWQRKVYDKLSNTGAGGVITLVRNWTNFAGIDFGFDPDAPFGSPLGAAEDSVFLQDFAGITGGYFEDVVDDDPEPALVFPLDPFIVQGLTAAGLVLLSVGVAFVGHRRLRRREK